MNKGIKISMQYFAEITKISDLIDPEVMADKSNAVDVNAIDSGVRQAEKVY